MKFFRNIISTALILSCFTQLNGNNVQPIDVCFVVASVQMEHFEEINECSEDAGAFNLMWTIFYDRCTAVLEN